MWTPVLLSLLTALPQGESSGSSERLDEAFARATPAFGALSALVTLRGEPLFQRAEGYLDAGQGVAAEIDSRYRAGALLGVFVRVAVLQRTADGRLGPTTPITHWWPELSFGDPAVTLTDLLDHTSGLPPYEVGRGVSLEDEAPTFDSLRTWLAQSGLRAVPGTCQEWSPADTLLLGRILETEGSATLSQLLAREVFTRWGMDSSAFDDAGVPARASEHAAHEFLGDVARDGHVGLPFGAERLCTTVGDLARFARGVTRRDDVGPALLPLALGAGAREAAAGRRGERGFRAGFNLGSSGAFASASFGGGHLGSWVHVAVYPDADLVLAFAGLPREVDAPDVLRRLERDLAREVLGLEPRDPVDVALTEDEARPFLGDYFVGCTRLSVERRDGAVHLVRADGGDTRLRYQGEHVFLGAEGDDLRLTFHFEGRLEGEHAESFVLRERGVESVARFAPLDVRRDLRGAR